MKISRIPLALALTSALAFGVGCADRNDGMAENTPTAGDRADATAMQPADTMAQDAQTAQTAQTQADAAYMDPTRDSNVDGLGDGRDSNQPVDDTWITTKVKSSLLADSDVAGLDINVDTLNGVVTLRGEVDEQAQIDEATRIAREIEGVTNVDTSGLTTANR